MTVAFGREHELTIVQTFIEGATERFSALVFEGAPGIGKTTVWRAAIQRAQERGFRSLCCRPAERETKLALSAVADLLEKVPEEVFGAIPVPQRRALEAARLRIDPGDAPEQARTLPTAVRSVLFELTRSCPLLVAVDDVQWLDTASAGILQFALRRLGDRQIAWLFARRAGAGDSLDLERVMSSEALLSVTIGPLSLAALHQLLTERLGQPMTRSDLLRVHRLSGGNPFHALEVGRELFRRGRAPGTSMPVPETLRELVLRRLRQLPTATRDALLTASALSAPTTALVDERALAPAEEADVVRIDGDGRVLFQHPLFASAIYEATSSSRRRELHRRLSQLVNDAEERARHVAIAITEPDEAVARMLEQGAILARGRGAWESAAELLERAAKLTPVDRRDNACRRRIAAAEHHVHAGNRPRARVLLECLLTEALSTSRRAHALRLLADISWNDENFANAMELFGQALECADDPRLAAPIELGLSYGHASQWNFADGVVHAYRALDHADATGDEPLVAEALALCVMLDYLFGRGVAWDQVERSLSMEDPHRVVPLQVRPSVIAGLLLLYVGRHCDARQRLREVWVTARERGDESDVAFIALWLSWLETRSANFGVAADLAEEAGWMATLNGSGSMHAWAIAQRAYIHAHRGDVDETRRHCLQAAPLVRRSGNVLPHLWIAASLSLLELSLGNAEAAWQACQPLTEEVEKQGIGEPVPIFFLPDALEALIALGKLDRAEALLHAFESRAQELDRVWAVATGARCRSLLLAARRDHADAQESIARAMAAHERLEMPFERARSLLVKGVIERRVGRRTQAQASLQEAAEAFERLGAALWAQRSIGELQRVGIRGSSGDQLTPSERRVAELAASGMKNREVAAALFISPKTVEANLARIYRKLGITTRAELGAHMAQRGQT